MAEPREQIMKVNEHVAFEVKVAGEGEAVVYLHGAGGLVWGRGADSRHVRHAAG